MTNQDTSMIYHYGLLLKERRKTHSLTQEHLSKLSGVSVKRIILIEMTGEATAREKERIDQAVYRFSIIQSCVVTTEGIDEQIEIYHGLAETILGRIKPCLNIERFSEVEELLSDLITEVSYYGLLISRAGFDERILDKVRRKRDIKTY